MKKTIVLILSAILAAPAFAQEDKAEKKRQTRAEKRAEQREKRAEQRERRAEERTRRAERRNQNKSSGADKAEKD